MESMLGTGRALKESESSNEYFRLSSTNSLLLIALARRGFIGENVSTLAISERCHCYDIILKSPKRHLAVEGSHLRDSAEKVGPSRLTGFTRSLATKFQATCHSWHALPSLECRLATAICTWSRPATNLPICSQSLSQNSRSISCAACWWSFPKITNAFISESDSPKASPVS